MSLTISAIYPYTTFLYVAYWTLGCYALAAYLFSIRFMARCGPVWRTRIWLHNYALFVINALLWFFWFMMGLNAGTLKSDDYETLSLIYPHLFVDLEPFILFSTAHLVLSFLAISEFPITPSDDDTFDYIAHTYGYTVDELRQRFAHYGIRRFPVCHFEAQLGEAAATPGKDGHGLVDAYLAHELGEFDRVRAVDTDVRLIAARDRWDKLWKRNRLVTPDICDWERIRLMRYGTE